jgi:hypothetical protein
MYVEERKSQPIFKLQFEAIAPDSLATTLTAVSSRDRSQDGDSMLISSTAA